MCISPIKVFNKVTGQELYVPCGRCSSCLVDSASSNCSKIMNDYDKSFNYFFCTLTYSNDFIPYVLLNDIYDKVPSLPVYRGLTVEEYVPFSNYLNCNFKFPKRSELRNFPFLNCIGVLRWKDLVNFHKRLRKHLSKLYGKKSSLYTYYQVSELGETFFRPHFHILFKTCLSKSQLFSAVRSCWPMCDWDSVPRAFEEAINPSSYMSFYLTSNFRLPSFYQIDEFKPKKSHSLHFGFHNAQFTFNAVVAAAQQHDLTYDALQVQQFGVAVRTSIPLPKYVVSRYFPKFKGFCRLSLDELYTLCHSLNGLKTRDTIIFSSVSESKKLSSSKFSDYYDVICVNNLSLASILYKLKYSYDDIKQTVNTINRVYSYCKEFNFDFDFYIYLWFLVPGILFSQSMKSSHEEILSPYDYRNFYYNVSDYVYGVVCAPTLDHYFDGCLLDEISSVSASDKRKFLKSDIKLTKFSKNNKIKTHLL